MTNSKSHMRFRLTVDTKTHDLGWPWTAAK